MKTQGWQNIRRLAKRQQTDKTLEDDDTKLAKHQKTGKTLADWKNIRR